jgi:hypothetical protein
MFEAGVGMVSVRCKAHMRSTEIDRVARRTRTELAAGRPVRLYVPLGQPNLRVDEGVAMKTLDRVRRAVGVGTAEREHPTLQGRRYVGLVLWPPPGDAGVREPRRPPPDANEQGEAVEPP